ncbi:hypothetical protein FRC12_020145 [Ceratobasidium sp. 428]|nr:hypothetical protein FRC12_020145 [Ceratobasidium sp. 428]
MTKPLLGNIGVVPFKVPEAGALGVPPPLALRADGQRMDVEGPVRVEAWLLGVVPFNYGQSCPVVWAVAAECLVSCDESTRGLVGQCAPGEEHSPRLDTEPGFGGGGAGGSRHGGIDWKRLKEAAIIYPKLLFTGHVTHMFVGDDASPRGALPSFRRVGLFLAGARGLRSFTSVGAPSPTPPV